MKNESPQSIIEYVGKSDHECLFGGKKLNAIARLEIVSFFVDIILKKFNIFLPLSNNNILNPPRIFLFFHVDGNNNITKSYVSYYIYYFIKKNYNPLRNLNIRFHTISIILARAYIFPSLRN